ncbi:MAG: flavin reductase family protein [Candidatus Bathyarchaeia archaeon]
MKLDKGYFYKLSVRPTVVISTISAEGVPNAAPFSFNSPVGINPPRFCFACNPKHDTWRNIRENGEFVVNYVGANFGPLMRILETDYPYGVNEIKEAGLTEVKSEIVKPPRIKEAYAWLECRMVKNLDVGDHILIVGDVLETEVKDEFMDDVIKVERAKPLNHIFGGYFVYRMKVDKFPRVES